MAAPAALSGTRRFAQKHGPGTAASMRRRPLIALPVLAVSLAAAAPAAADDASLFAAYDARQASGEVRAASDAWKAAFAIVEKSDGDRGVRGVIRANKAINALMTTIEGELEAQVSSSETGARAKRAAIREVRGWRRANRYENRGWRRALDGLSSGRQFDRAGDEMADAFRDGQRAVRRFGRVGLSSSFGAITKAP